MSRRRRAWARLGKRALGFLVALAALAAHDAGAAERTVPLLLDEGIQVAVDPSVTLSGRTMKAGAILVPDEILAIDGGQALKNDPVVAQWGKTHRFLIIPLSVSVNTEAGLTPIRLTVSGGFAGASGLERQPLVRDVFPSTSFKQGAISSKGQLSLKAGARFPAPTEVVTAEAGADVALTFAYAPAFANVTAGHGSSTFFWTFVAAQDWQPVGKLPLWLLVAQPRMIKTLVLNLDVQAELKGSWWEHGGRAVATQRIVVRIP